MSGEEIILVLGGLAAGLHAGLLYDFAIDVVPSMQKLKPKAHIEMFQAIDKTILGPIFGFSFFGPILLLPLAAFLFRGTDAFVWLAAAAAVHILGSNLVTMAVHLPLNAGLAKVDTQKISDAEAEKIRTAFQGNGSKWNRFHTVRTLSSTAALVFVLAASVV
jgi:uncharacterized membrane protein